MYFACVPGAYGVRRELPGNGVTEVCGSPYRCWVLSQGLQEQQVLLTSKPYLQPRKQMFLTPKSHQAAQASLELKV